MRKLPWSFLSLSLLPCGIVTRAAEPATAAATTAPRELRVLFVGNSLVYVNNLPATLRALAAAQAAPARITTATFVAPGGTVAERWKDGHAAVALRGGKWDAIVLQERGGLLACMVDVEQRAQGECRASERSHRQFADLAMEHGSRTLLLATWGPDEAWQLKLDRAIKQLASRTSADVVPAGSVLRAYAAQHPQTPTFPDKVHPNLPATLIMAAQLYRAITGGDAQARDVTIDFPLLPANALIKADAPMEGQPQLAGNGKRIVIKADVIAMLLEASKP